MKTYKLELTDEQVETLKKCGIIEDKNDRWFEPKDENFFALCHDGIIIGRDSDNNDAMFKRQPVFRTEAEAKKADQWRIALTTILKWRALNTEEWEWTYSERSYYVELLCNRLTINWNTFVRLNPLPLYFKTEKDAQACLNACRKEFEILFGMNKE